MYQSFNCSESELQTYRTGFNNVHYTVYFDSVKGSFIYGYASVFINGNFFIIGGWTTPWAGHWGENSNTIARLDAATWSWSKAGQLNTSRRGHGAIWINSKLVVVGGYALTKQTEFCDLANDEFTCTYQQSILEDYAYYPMLFAVSDNYRNC